MPIYVMFTEKDYDQSVADFKKEVDKSITCYDIDSKDMKLCLAKVIEELIKDKIDIEVKQDGVYINNEQVEY